MSMDIEVMPAEGSFREEPYAIVSKKKSNPVPNRHKSKHIADVMDNLRTARKAGYVSFI